MSAHCLLSLTWPQKSLETPLETSLETPQENIFWVHLSLECLDMLVLALDVHTEQYTPPPQPPSTDG